MNLTPWLCVIVLAATPALAQRRPTRTRPTQTSSSSSPPPANPDDLEAPATAMPDTDTLLEVIQTAAVTGSPDGARAISQLLLRGVPPRIAAAGLDALGVMGRAEGSPAVLRFLEHRRPMLRRHAVAAAQAIHTPALVSALVGRLCDSDEDVRVDAAAALADVGSADAAATLFTAFERDLEAGSEASGRLLHESAKAIARIGNTESVTRLLTFLRRAPFRSMADAMRSALSRRDLPESFRVHIVQAVGDLATREVRDFLHSVIADAHGVDSGVVRAARTAADRIAE